MAMLLLAFFLIALVDFIPVIKKRQWSTAGVFLIIFISALVLSVMEIMNVKIPSVMQALGDVMKSIGLSY